MLNITALLPDGTRIWAEVHSQEALYNDTALVDVVEVINGGEVVTYQWPMGELLMVEDEDDQLQRARATEANSAIF